MTNGLFSEARAALERARGWWREPHFLEKDAGIGLTVMLIGLIVAPPSSPGRMLLALGWMVVVALLPFHPREICLIAPILLLVMGFLPDGWWTSGGFAVVTLFLAIGYVLSNRTMLALLVGYAAADSVCFALFGTRSMGSGVVEGMIAGFGATIPADPSASMPGYAAIAGIATGVFDILGFGFLIVFGAAFRRASAAGERAARAERLLGRVTREQALAHMIHDAVANDMSTIAMLAWRAKATDDDAAMLDAIYARSHHALARVHDVIDVLNGKRDLAGLESEVAAENAAAGVAEGAAGGGVAGGNAAPPFDVELEKYLEDQDRTMAMLGFAGTSRIDVTGDSTGTGADGTAAGAADAAADVNDTAVGAAGDIRVPKPVQRVVMELIEEIYANIVRHCAMPDGAAAPAPEAAPASAPALAYSLFIGIDGSGIRISEVNALAGDTPTLMRGHRHGGGLAMHRAAVEALGGTLDASAQDGAWTIGVEIPLRPVPMETGSAREEQGDGVRQ